MRTLDTKSTYDNASITAYNIMHWADNASHALDLAAEFSLSTVQDWDHETTIVNFRDGSALVVSGSEIRASVGSVIPLYEVIADVDTGEWISEPKFLDYMPEAGWHYRKDTDAQACDTYEHDGETRAILINWTY